MKTNPFVLTTCIVGALLAAPALKAQNLDKHWDNGGGDQNWSNPLNWSGDALPATGLANNGDNLHFNTLQGSHAIYTAAQGSSVYRSIRIGDVAGGNNAVLEVTGGSLSSDNTAQTRIATGGRTATLNQSGGTVAFGGYMQVGLDPNSVGNINLSGGTLISVRNGTVGGIGGVSMVLGDGNTARGNFTLSGGELRTRTGVMLGNPATTGKGRFEVQGAGIANIGTENAGDDGFWTQSAGSTLAALVTGGTLGSIFVDDLGSAATSQYNDGNVTFAAGSLLEVGFNGAAVAGSWDLMKWEGVLYDGGLALAPSVTDPNWSFAFLDTGGVVGPDTLRITYAPVPEPGVGVLAGLGVMLVVWRLRKRA